MASDGDSAPSSPYLTNADLARRKATAAMLAGDLRTAIKEFTVALEHVEESSVARLELLRLRCTSLVRAGRDAAALDDAEAAIAMLNRASQSGGGPADGPADVSALPPADLAAKVWQLHGIALSTCCNGARASEAAASFAKALQHRAVHQTRVAARSRPGSACVGSAAPSAAASARPTTAAAARPSGASAASTSNRRALIEQFLAVAPLASETALPFEVYAAPADDEAGAALGASLGRSPRAAATPVFRLQLRPKFTPWPLDVWVAATEPQAVGKPLATKLSVFCTPKDPRVQGKGGAAQEPHLSLLSHDAEREAMVRPSRPQRGSGVAG